VANQVKLLLNICSKKWIPGNGLYPRGRAFDSRPSLPVVSQVLCDFHHAVAQLVEALRCKPEGRGLGFNLEFKNWNVSLT
jgi:hypothetical protein